MKSLPCFEIVGIAGSGKTTLARELENRNNHFHLKVPPDWKQLKSFPFYIKNSLSLAPVFASMVFGHHGQWLSLEELFWMIFLNGWHRQLIRLGSEKGKIVLDQGPVYMLSQMILCREGQMINSFFREWWKKILDKWRGVLKIIIWLDSSDTVLADRINRRRQNHLVKGASFRQMQDFLQRHRVALDMAIALLRADHCNPAIICFDTGQQSLDEIVDNLLREFRLNGK
jgi:shikimate kinase